MHYWKNVTDLHMLEDSYLTLPLEFNIVLLKDSLVQLLKTVNYDSVLWLFYKVP